MAAIDKLHGTYDDLEALRLWVIVYYPKMLRIFYAPFMNYTELKDYGCNSETVFPIANLNHRQDLVLLWRCPLRFVRTYLEKQCGLKTRWYHKLFFANL